MVASRPRGNAPSRFFFAHVSPDDGGGGGQEGDGREGEEDDEEEDPGCARDDQRNPMVKVLLRRSANAASNSRFFEVHRRQKLLAVGRDLVRSLLQRSTVLQRNVQEVIATRLQIFKRKRQLHHEGEDSFRSSSPYHAFPVMRSASRSAIVGQCGSARLS